VTTTTDPEPESFVALNRRYLFVGDIPYFVDSAGRVLLERAWYHDLVEHLTYLPMMTMAAPKWLLSDAPPDLVALDEAQRARLTLVALPRSRTRSEAIWNLLPTMRAIWKAVGQADVVHAGIAGWPYPAGWLAFPMAKARGKKSVMIVESAPWRLGGSGALGRPSVQKRLEAYIYERMARWCCSKADVSFFTQPVYLQQLHGDSKEPAYVAPATWVNAENVVTESEAIALWDAKAQETARFLFAGRLVPEKGVNVLLAAIQKLAADGVVGAVDVIGDGPLRETVRREAAASAASGASFRLNYLEPVPYGAPFFNLLQRYHGLLLPSLSDEQPRVVFDAAARAVPVIASGTDGLSPHVEHGGTGLLVPPGEVDAFAEAMRSWAVNPAPLRQLALRALANARHQTHRAMHARRSQILAQHLNP
jgi:glycosyltransferase involved in cell wall biosynthesis